MTEKKRFTNDIHRIYDNNEEIACADTMGDAEILVDLLNEKEEKIQQLKEDNKGYKSNYEMLKNIPILFIGGVPYVSVQEIYKGVESVISRQEERINGDVE